MSNSEIECDDARTKYWSLPEFSVQSHRCHISKKLLKVTSSIAKNNIIEDTHSGFKQGYEAGLVQAKTDINAQLNALQNLISAIVAENEKERLHIKHSSFSFIQLATERIISEILSEQPEKIKDLAQKAIDTLDNRIVAIKILCHEGLFDILNANKNLFQGKTITIEKDATLKPFGFTIESDHQLIEFDIQGSVNKLIDDYKCLTIK